MIIYLASPYAAYANPQESVNVQIDAFAILRDLGHEPIAPLLSHYIDQRHPASYERWLQWCLAMVSVSDVVLRLPGASDGADREVAEAKRLGKPVVHSIDELQNPGTYYEVVCCMPPYREPAETAAVAKQNVLDHFSINAEDLKDYDFVVDSVRAIGGEKVIA